MRTIILLVFLALGIILNAQVAINSDGSAPNTCAMLDVKSTNQGILIPRLSTSQRNAVPSPATGLLVYNRTTNLFNYFNGSFWYEMQSTFITDTSGTQSPGGGVSVNSSGSINPDNSAMLDANDSIRGILVPRINPFSILSPVNGLIVYNSLSNYFNYFNGTAWLELAAVSTGVPGVAGSQASAGYAIKNDGSEAHPSAMLDVSATDKGLLIPRLTNIQRDSILPVTGLTIYNLSANEIEYYNGSGWYRLNLSFNCGLPLVDSRDGQSYNTVQIGQQCWMAESLNVGTMTANNTVMANNGMIDKWCYNNDELRCQEYGALYQWDEAMQYTTTEYTQGICPMLWHLPSETEWDMLDDFLGGYNSSGGAMKETGTVHWVSPNTGATNTSGFTGIGSGVNDYNSATPSSNLRTHNYIWSSTQYGTTYARRRALLYFNAKSNPYFDLKWLGFSVRCVKN